MMDHEIYSIKSEPFPSQAFSFTKCLRIISDCITGTLENIFYRWGVAVASKPWVFIIGTIVLTGICSVGFLRFHSVSDPEKMWIPIDSNFILTKSWIENHFPGVYRHETVILTADNVLTMEIMQQISLLQQRILGESPDGYKFEQLCARLPQASVESLPFEISHYEPTRILLRGGTSRRLYCNVIKTLPMICWQRGLHELWGSDELDDVNWNDQLLIDLVNHATHSPTFGIETNFREFLGGIRYNESGHIVGASATILDWVILTNESIINEKVAGNVAGTGSIVDPTNDAWEDYFLKSVLDYDYPEGIKVYANSKKSFSELSEGSVLSDIPLLILSVVVMYLFVGMNLGTFTAVKNRMSLSVFGVLSIVLAILSAVGLCSAFGLPYSPVHNLMPLLVQGLGVDDMFVMTQTFDRMILKDRKLTIPQIVGITMKNAGVSITITSLTDFVAFAIGGTTILPCLRSFCIYAGVAILLTYLYQITLFLGFLTYDIRRRFTNRDAIFPCVVHDYDHPKCADAPSFLDQFLGKLYSLLLDNVLLKILVLLMTSILLVTGIYGTMFLQQRFDLVWFIPKESYLRDFLDAFENKFTDLGTACSLYIGQIEYHTEIHNLRMVIEDIYNSDYVLKIESWVKDFDDWLKIAKIDSFNVSKEVFYEQLGLFLFTPKGGKYQMNFELDGELQCGKPAPVVLSSRIDFWFRRLNHSEQVHAMWDIESVISRANLSDFAAAWSWYFSSWEIETYIGPELLRNMLLAVGFIFLTMLFLIANINSSTLAVLCVVMTIVDVAGGIYYMGLTIEIVTSLNMILAIGLSVDYAVHISHTFMKRQGALSKRSLSAVTSIGPAIIYGASSTALGVIFLARSNSYVFSTFFKVIILSTTLGLFHGIVFLPVLLSFIGPPSYISIKASTDTINLPSPQTFDLKNIPPTLDESQVKLRSEDEAR